jgi:hypothetical protein
MELAPAFPRGTASTSRRLSLAGKAAQGVDGAAAGNDVCRSGNAYGLRRRISLSAIVPECPGHIDRDGKRHVGIDPAVRHSDTDGELEQNAEITDGIERWIRKYGDGTYLPSTLFHCCNGYAVTGLLLDF